MTSTSENRYDTPDTILDSRALAVDLVAQGYAAVMDCNLHRLGDLVIEGTEGMSTAQLRRLVNQLSWCAGALAAQLPDAQRQTTLVILTTENEHV